MDYPRTVYVVDDDNDDLDFFCEAAARIDQEIICVTSNDSAASLNSFRAFDVPVPDLIFVDLNMPLVDGRAFLAELKKLKIYSQVPVIIYSTSSHAKDKEETRLLGAADFLTKPCSQDELIHELEEIFSRYSMAISLGTDYSPTQG